MKNHIIIADWAEDSLSRQEYTSAFLGHLSGKPAMINFVCSTPNTIHTSFLLHQVLITEMYLGDPNNLVVFVNTDPRIHTEFGTQEAQGAPLVVARMKNNAFVFGPNAGYTYSLVKRQIEYLYLYEGFDRGSQFRSRDLYSRIGALLVEEKEEEMQLEEIALEQIPELSSFYIGHIDNFGNIKTTIPNSFLSQKITHGQEITIEIAGIKKKASFEKHIFAKPPGALVIAPGSSGYKNDPYLEIVVREKTPKGSAAALFKNPAPGTEVKIELQ